MIKLNNRDYPWEKDMYIESFLKRLENTQEFSYIGKKVPIILLINNSTIPPYHYKDTLIKDGDCVQIYPVLSGG